MRKTAIIFLLGAMAVMLLPGCREKTSSYSSYAREIQEWRRNRLERLKSPTGWLSLAGLYWLEPGENPFGSDSSNALVFPPKAPAQMGVFILSGETVRLKAAPGAAITVAGQPVQELEVYREGQEEPLIMEHGSLSWFIIKRGPKIGVRLRDSENPAIAALRFIDSYPLDPAWRVPARLETYPQPKKIPIENILGMVEEEESPGVLVFELQGQTFRLETLDGGDELFVIFRDKTSGKETYGAGRYLYVPRPAGGDVTWIDFNKAYNPPCVFTDYATCPLPPPQNDLPIAVTAGEKHPGKHYF